MPPEASLPKSPKSGPAPAKPGPRLRTAPGAAATPLATLQIRRARGEDGPVDARLPPLNNKTAKVHRLVRLLQDHSEGLSIRHISTMLGVDERTVKRYLSELRRLKFDLSQDRQGSGRKSLYRILPTGSPPTHFLPALKKIRTELHAGGNPKYTALISQLMRFLEDKESAQRDGNPEETPNAEAYHIDHGPFAEADPSPGILKILEASIAARTAVKLSYSGSHSEPGDMLFFPYSLCLRVGTLYLIGRQGENTGPFKSLSVKRIRRGIATRDVFTRSAFHPADYYKYTIGQWARQLDEDPETVLLSIRAPWLEKFLSESHFNPPGRIVKKGKDAQFEVKMVIKTDFVNWVMSLAPDLIPEKPDSLRKEVSRRLRESLETLEG